MVVIATIALAIDLGYILLTKTELHAAADSAALAGGTELLAGLGVDKTKTPAEVDTAARAAAVAFAANNYAGDSVYSNEASATSPSDPTDLTPPVVTIVSPDDGDQVSRNVQVTVEAVDNVDVALVRLYVDNVLTCESSTSPLACTWKTRKESLGPHILRATASDAMGNVGQDVIYVELEPKDKGKGRGKPPKSTDAGSLDPQLAFAITGFESSTGTLAIDNDSDGDSPANSDLQADVPVELPVSDLLSTPNEIDQLMTTLDANTDTVADDTSDAIPLEDADWIESLISPLTSRD